MARNRNKQGIPELTKFADGLESVYDALESRSHNKSSVRLSREEQAIVDVCETIGFIEGNGLHSFWYNEIDQMSVIQSFRMIGADQVANVLEESSWAKSICERGADKQGQLFFTEEETRRLDAIEERIYDGFQNVSDRALEFLRQNGIKG